MSEQITFFIRAINTKCLGFITHMEVCSNIRHPEACMRETKYGNTRQDVLAVASANCVAECINRAAQIFGGFLPQTPSLSLPQAVTPYQFLGPYDPRASRWDTLGLILR